jgi:hypothetical protein
MPKFAAEVSESLPWALHWSGSFLGRCWSSVRNCVQQAATPIRTMSVSTLTLAYGYSILLTGDLGGFGQVSAVLAWIPTARDTLLAVFGTLPNLPPTTHSTLTELIENPKGLSVSATTVRGSQEWTVQTVQDRINPSGNPS